MSDASSPDKEAPSPALPPDTPSATAHSASVGLGTVIAIAACLSAFSGFLAWHFASNVTAPTRIVAIDTEKIIRAKTSLVMSQPNMTPELAAQSGRELASALTAVIDGYKDAGYLVIHGGVVFGAPDGVDITAATAAKIGVSLK